MIYDKLKNCMQYAGVSPYFAKAFAFMMEHDLETLPVGKYEIDGANAYLMVQEMNLKDWEEGVWEGHRNYADIQMAVYGGEILGVRSMEGIAVEKPYNPEKDVEFFDQKAEGSILPLEKGDFAVLFPQDLHRPGIRKPGGALPTRRIVVKVRV